MRKLVVATLVGGGLILTACASTPTAEKTITAQVPTTVVVTESALPASSSSSSSLAAAPTSTAAAPVVPPVDEVVPLGSTQTIPGRGRVTAYAIDRAVPPPQYDDSGAPRTALDAEVCVEAASAGVSADPWSLVDANSGRYTKDYDSDGKLPQYPLNLTPVAVGECTRGWIMINIPPETQVTGVRYALSDGSAVLRWSVPA